MLNLFDIKQTLKYWSHVKPIGNIKTAEDIANLFEKYLTYLRFIAPTGDIQPSGLNETRLEHI